MWHQHINLLPPPLLSPFNFQVRNLWLHCSSPFQSFLPCSSPLYTQPPSFLPLSISSLYMGQVFLDLILTPPSFTSLHTGGIPPNLIIGPPSISFLCMGWVFPNSTPVHLFVMQGAWFLVWSFNAHANVLQVWQGPILNIERSSNLTWTYCSSFSKSNMKLFFNFDGVFFDK
jgi:hypothetical protein